MKQRLPLLLPSFLRRAILLPPSLKLRWASLLLLLPLLLPAQPAWIRDSLDRVVLQAMQEEQVPGLALAVIKDGKVVLQRTYGLREAGKPARVDENTLFMIGSNSKAYTATALAMLEHDGKLGLDDKVTKWLPSFRLYDDCRTQQATLRDLLCHRLGTRTFQGDFTFWTSNLTRQEVMQKMALLKPPYEFRTRFGYCNSAFLTAGEVIPVANGGQTWEDFMRNRIFQPLKMSRAVALSAEMPNASNAAVPHALFDQKLLPLSYPKIDNLAPAGSISLSVSDMTHWILMQLDTGRYEGVQVFQKSVILNTWNAQTIVNPRNLYSYSLGWFVSYKNGKKMLDHTGGVDGFLTASCFIPEERLGVIVLTNTDNNAVFNSLREQLADVYMGINKENRVAVATADWKKGDKAEAARIAGLRAKVAEKRPLALPLQAYSGVYSNSVYGDVEVRLDQNNLKVWLSRHPNGTATLENMGEYQFLATFANPTLGIHPLVFAVENGQIMGLTLKVNDFVEFEAYEFRKK